ncbi:erythromycin esterase family protein [Actinomycetospora lutea]|uniref:erythromycin esterase family protein n=1 Tax=Actinomycetospora lutea TaxID=663604 RepID=UPI00236727F1|nr:erythromycin esterase family protein [Actinomycetospora lutea]MDD7942738.1 erythromycin esterase family protein [Actinomycetospora lutea]
MTLPQPLPHDDLAAVDALVGDASIVAIGENNHGIREFGELRARLVLHLVRERGFGVVALESGFAEGALVDAWVQGGDGSWDDVARDGFTFRAGDHPEMRALVHALRSHVDAGGSVRFAGLDVPGSGGSPEPALARLRSMLPADLVDPARAATAAYASANNGVAPGRWSALSAADQDAATTALARLLLRASGDPLAWHLALGALRLDEQLREFAVLSAPDPPALVASSRDAYMAETARYLRASGEKVVLLMHNGHAQRVPFTFLRGVSAPSAGTLLAEELGDDYVVLGLTALTGTTTGLALDDTARHGIALSSVPLEEPAPDSVEQAVADLGGGPVLLDLRAARGAPGPGSIRHATTHVPVDVAAGYDGVFCLPRQSVSAA